MNYLNKFLLAFFLSFTTISVFAQLQKGDVWLDFSPQNFQQNTETVFFGSENIGFVLSTSSFQSRMGYGKFIGDNTLLGFKLNGSINPDRSIFFISETNKRLDASLFVKRYFGQKSLRLFAETSLNTELKTGSSIFNVLNIQSSEHLNWKIGGGLAYFLNEHASLEFSYNLRPLAVTLNGAQFFSKNLAPDFGIGLRYFILKNRTGVQNLNADKTLEQGTLSVDFYSEFLVGKQQNLRQTGLSAEYFIRKNFQLKTVFGFDNKKFLFNFIDNNGEQSDHLTDINNNYFGGISGLYFLRVNKKLSVDAGLGIKLTRNPNIGLGFIGTSVDRRKFLEDELSLRLGLSIYLGRHLLRPHFVYLQRSFDSDAPNTEQVSFNDFSFNLDYELFLAENLSLNLGLSYIDDYKWVEPESINFAMLQLTPKSSDVLRANFGFKWYLRRGSK